MEIINKPLTDDQGFCIFEKLFISSMSPLRKVIMMILPHRVIGHKDFHIVDYESKTYVKAYDSMCLCGSEFLNVVDSSINVKLKK
jgi:hypothetical protein